MTVSTTLRLWSATAANNSPKGTDVIGTSADDELRQIQATVRQYLASQSTTVVPSAGVADLTTATGHWVPISGSASITGLGSEDAGIEYILNFTGAPTLIHSTALQLPGQATVVGDTAMYAVAESLGSGNWRLWGMTRYDSMPARNPVLLPTAATTSGSAVNSGAIASWAREITVNFSGVSTTGTNAVLIQMSTGGSFTTSGYDSSSSVLQAGAATTNYTTGFGIRVGAATDTLKGSVRLSLVDPSTNTWAAEGIVNSSPNSSTFTVAGTVALSGTVDQVRVITADAFDAGLISVLYK